MESHCLLKGKIGHGQELEEGPLSRWYLLETVKNVEQSINDSRVIVFFHLSLNELSTANCQIPVNSQP